MTQLLAIGIVPEKKNERFEAHKQTINVLKEELAKRFGEDLAAKILVKYEKIMKEYWLKGKGTEFQSYKWGKEYAGGAAVNWDAAKTKVETELIEEVARLLANRTVISFKKDDKETVLKDFKETWIADKNMEYVLTSAKQIPEVNKTYTANLHHIDAEQGKTEAAQKAANKSFGIIYKTEGGEAKERYLHFPDGLTNKEVAQLTDPKTAQKFLAANADKYALYEDIELSLQLPGKGPFVDPATKTGIVAVYAHHFTVVKMEEEKVVSGKK